MSKIIGIYNLLRLRMLRTKLKHWGCLKLLFCQLLGIGVNVQGVHHAAAW